MNIHQRNIVAGHLFNQSVADEILGHYHRVWPQVRHAIQSLVLILEPSLAVFARALPNMLSAWLAKVA